MRDYSYFELRRQSDQLVYQFSRTVRADGSIGYKRHDKDLWIVWQERWGWIAVDPLSGAIAGRAWDTLPEDQTDHPPAGIWVSRKGAKSYVYSLVYPR